MTHTKKEKESAGEPPLLLWEEHIKSAEPKELSEKYFFIMSLNSESAMNTDTCSCLLYVMTSKEKAED